MPIDWAGVGTSLLTSAGSSLLGGLFGGSGSKGRSVAEQSETNRDNQLKLARHMPAAIALGAKEAGFHPLATLGIPTAGALPVYEDIDRRTGDSLGQNLGRAISANYKSGYDKQMDALSIERAKLQNELLRGQVSNVTNGQPNTGIGAYEVNPDENISALPGQGGLTAGSAKPSPAGKKFKVGDTPYGPVFINLPPSGQADEYGELYGGIKGLEYMAKRGLVHYRNGVYKAGRALRSKIDKISNSKRQYKRNQK
jgi:hypothetical protein